MNNIHETVKIGQYCVFGLGVSVGEGTVIGHHCVIHDGSIIGKNVRIDDFACIGKLPSKAKNSAVTKETSLSSCKIGAGCIIGTGAIIYRSAVLGRDCLAADYSVIRENVTVGENTIIGKGVTIENQCSIGSRVKLQTNAYITAYSSIGDDCFVGPCVVTSNDNFAGRSKERFSHFKGIILKKGGRIGAGATILPGREINEDSFAAAGSVVTRDVCEKTIVMGNPAREAGKVKTDQLLVNQQKKISEDNIENK